jgi:predicted RNA binding protein YcfA (HicA-like mRNA interferase family)
LPKIAPFYTNIVYFRSFHAYSRLVNGAEFVRRTKRYASKAGLTIRFDTDHGKGSHGMLYIGHRRTVVQRGELKPGTFRAMLKQLGIPKEDF